MTVEPRPFFVIFVKPRKTTLNVLRDKLIIWNHELFGVSGFLPPCVYLVFAFAEKSFLLHLAGRGRGSRRRGLKAEPLHCHTASSAPGMRQRPGPAAVRKGLLLRYRAGFMSEKA